MPNVREYLSSLEVPFKVVPAPAAYLHVPTVARGADAGTDAVKTVALDTESGRTLLVVPKSQQLDMRGGEAGCSRGERPLRQRGRVAHGLSSVRT